MASCVRHFDSIDDDLAAIFDGAQFTDEKRCFAEMPAFQYRFILSRASCVGITLYALVFISMVCRIAGFDILAHPAALHTVRNKASITASNALFDIDFISAEEKHVASCSHDDGVATYDVAIDMISSSELLIERRELYRCRGEKPDDEA